MSSDSHKRHVICGEAFLVQRRASSVLLMHPCWPLMGSGSTLRAAEEDLVMQARELRSVLLDVPYDALNDQSRAVLDFQRRLARRHD